MLSQSLPDWLGRRVVYDHKHTNSDDRGTPYVFESAEQLVTDFFSEVDKVLRKIQ